MIKSILHNIYVKNTKNINISKINRKALTISRVILDNIQYT